MKFPFDAWCGVSSKGTTIVCTGCFTDVSIAFTCIEHGERYSAAVNRMLFPLSRLASSTIGLPMDASLELHRVILLGGCPSYFTPLLLADASSNGQGAYRASSCSSSRCLREDRVCPEACAIGIPSTLRFLYSGIIGTCDIERVLLHKGTDHGSTVQCGDVQPLDARSTIHVLLVAAAWCCNPCVPTGGNTGLPTPSREGAETAETHGEMALIRLVEYLFEYIMSCCDYATALRFDGPPSPAAPASQVRMTLPSLNGSGDDERTSESIATEPSRAEVMLMLVDILRCIDELADAQRNFLAAQSSVADDRGDTKQQHRAGGRHCTSLYFGPVHVFLHNRPQEMTSAGIASQRDAIRAALQRPTSDWTASTIPFMFETMWFRAQEGLMALTVDSIGSQLLTSALPELAVKAEEGDDDEGQHWAVCAGAMLEEAFSPTGDHGGLLVVRFPSEASMIAAALPIDLTNATALLDKVPLRILSWVLWRWAHATEQASSDAFTARQELLGQLGASYADATPPPADAIEHALRTECNRMGEDESLVAVLGRVYRCHSHLLLQQVAIARIAAGVLSTLGIRRVSVPDAEAGAGATAVLDVSVLESIRKEVEAPLPGHYLSPDDSDTRSLSVWQALTEAICFAPSEGLAVRVGGSSPVRGGIVPLPLLPMSIDAMALWDASVQLRDGRMVQRLMRLFASSSSSSDEQNSNRRPETRRCAASGTPLFWGALSRASAALVSGGLHAKAESPIDTMGCDDEPKRKLRRMETPVDSATNTGSKPPSTNSTTSTHNEGTCYEGLVESLPLFPSLLTALANAATPQRLLSNPNALFPSTAEGIADGFAVPPLRSWQQLVADDEEQLRGWMSAITDLCSRLIPAEQQDEGEEGIRDDELALAAVKRGGDAKALSMTVSSASQERTQDGEDGEERGPLQPRLLTNPPHHRQAKEGSGSPALPHRHLSDLVHQLELTRQARAQHLGNIRAALHETLASELVHVQATLRTMTEDALTPALDAVRQLEASRQGIQGHMESVQLQLQEMHNVLAAHQRTCTSQMDDARMQMAHYRAVMDAQELKAAQLMDQIDTKVLPQLEAQRAAALSSMLTTISDAVASLQHTTKL